MIYQVYGVSVFLFKFIGKPFLLNSGLDFSFFVTFIIIIITIRYK